MINKYDEFIKEKEFNSIIESILLISESGKWTADNVYEWEEESTKDKLKKFLTKLPKEKIKEYFNIFLGKIPKNVKKRVLASYLFIFLSLVSYSELVDNNNKIDHKTKQTIGMMVDNNKHSVIKKEIKIEPVVVKKKTREDFLKDLAFKESSGNWKVINRFGYIGLYQFGRSALKDAGYKHIHKRDFKKDPNIFPVADQNKAMINLLKKNQHYMREKRGFEGYKHYISHMDLELYLMTKRILFRQTILMSLWLLLKVQERLFVKISS